jgi:ATP phosphoribosyltransferase
MTSSHDPETIRLALPSKGHLHDGIVEILRTAGYKIRRPSDRQYEATISGHDRFHVVFMRPADIVAQVQEGRCHLGVTGMDVYAEHRPDAPETTVVMADLGYGGCRLVVAVPESWVDVTHILDLVDLASEFKAAGRTFRVSTKYPTLTREFFRRRGITHYQLIPSDGALELHPSLGIADVIVDLTSSGSTLKENRLREIAAGTVLESGSCLIGNRPGLSRLIAEGDESPLVLLLDAMDGVRASQGFMLLEVVGDGDSFRAGEVASYLHDRQARHVVRGDVLNADGTPGWRVTALIAGRNLTGHKRKLLSMGASRIVGLPALAVFERDGHSSFDALRENLCGIGNPV